MLACCRLTLSNQLTAIADTMRQVEQFMTSHRISNAAVPAALLALEESLVNIVTHGFNDDRLHLITVDITLSDKHIALEITDDGIPFDPISLPPPDRSAPLEARPIGGLGVWLTKQMMTDMRYRREDERNKLLLLKEWA